MERIGAGKYLKAFVGTLIFVIIGFAVVSYLDGQRTSSLASQLELAATEEQETQQLLFYENLYGKSDMACQELSRVMALQMQNTRGALEKFEAAQQETLLSDTSLLKRRYLGQSMMLYLTLEKYRQDCGNASITPLVYFYTDKSYNPEEAAEQKVLDSARQSCPSLWIFSFPHDAGIPVVDLLVSKYAITSYPSILVGGEKLSGVVPKETITKKIQCSSGP